MTRGNVAKGAFNFGQQPFAASNVTYDQDAGIVTLADASPNTSEVWSDQVTVLPSVNSGSVSDGFDGNNSTSFRTPNSASAAVIFTPNSSILLTSDLMFTGSLGSNQGYEISIGSDVIEGGNSVPEMKNYSIAGTSGKTIGPSSPLTFKSLGSGEAIYFNQLVVNGKILVDADSTIDNSQIWSSQANTEAVVLSNTFVFDGDVSTSNLVAASNADSTVVFTLTPVPVGAAVEIKTRADANAGDIECNGVTITDKSTAEVITDCGVTTSDTLTIYQYINSGQTSGDGNQIFYVKVGDKILVDAQGFTGGTYNTLYQTWDQYATYGLFFYNENTDEIIQKFTLQRRYGLTGAKPSAGIYELAVQPNFAVAAYIKEDETYVPIENPEPRIAAAEAQAEAEIAVVKAQAATEVAAAEAETRKYQRMLIRAACGWVLAKAYTAGDIIIYNGHVFRALEDNVATADNDPGDLDGTWEFLGLEEDAAP